MPPDPHFLIYDGIRASPPAANALQFPPLPPKPRLEILAAEMMSPDLAVPSHSSLIAVKSADREKPLIYATAYCCVTSLPCPFTTSLNSSGLSSGSSRSSNENAAVF